MNENFSSDSAHKESTFKTSDDSDDDLVSKPNIADKLNDEKERKPYSFENGSLPSINQNQFYYTDSKSNSSEAKSPFSSYFDLDYLPKSNQNSKNIIPNKTNSDDNNNIKRRLSLDNDTPIGKLEQIRRKITPPNNSIKNSPKESPKEEHFEQCDASSEKSDELKGLDETVSWLEFHEKLNNQSEYVETKVELRKKDENKEIKSTSEDLLPYDKKSALLSALREIDSENYDKSLTSPTKLNKIEEKNDRKIIKTNKFSLNSKPLKSSM